MEFFSITIAMSPKEYKMRVKKLFKYRTRHSTIGAIMRPFMIITFFLSSFLLYFLYAEFDYINKYLLLQILFNMVIILLLFLSPHFLYFIYKNKPTIISKHTISFFHNKFYIQYSDKSQEVYFNELYQIKISKHGLLFILNKRSNISHSFLMFPISFFTKEQYSLLQSWVVSSKRK
jgi:hypothetical protein